jgi:hypothetical protein
LAAPDGRSTRDEALDTLCKLAGVSSVHAYLSLAPDASAKEGLIALERKRREMERALSDPRREREAEQFLELYDEIRGVVAPAGVPSPDLTGDVPDYYKALDVDPSAPFGDIETAWRDATARGMDADPRVAQAWRVLGDPLTRANYDRMRRERAAADARRTSPLRDLRTPQPSSNRPPTHAPPVVAPPSVCEVLGAEVREVVLESTSPETAIVSLMVHGTARWTAAISSDHPALTTRPEHGLSLAPGRHTLVVRIDPAKVSAAPLSCTLTLSNAHETHTVVFRVRRAVSGPRRPWEAFAMGAGAVSVLILAALIGNRLSVVTPHDDAPTTQGMIAQLPSVAACFTPDKAPLPAYVDVHTDGFGRPSGVTFGGPASLAADSCVRAALLQLSFPLTPDGLPAVHRYRLTPSTGSP